MLEMRNNNNPNIAATTTATKLSIWDTAGQEKFHALGPIYYRDANGAVVVYDITDQDSFLRAQIWVKELRKMVGGEDQICIALLGNKSDMEASRNVNRTQAEQYAKLAAAQHSIVSAKSGLGIEKAFLKLTNRMVQMDHSKNNNDSFTPDTGNSKGLVVLSSNDVSTQSSSQLKSCC
eukprot:CAMPEP_0197840298 /NCGR_PEP_ID=MMETSP1437-20131217/45527_1 /TAXON_ID=49252 ORGANISM="Eucampia antarctica, Strain CCMP1452" /NCGR_SAMPLE_ID=MMETSP1437 /ASSEMBLY_ACC=CAM_ASM_001096 /LENGTH=176 /DNA_ID=CAMNT_0043449891 /DNA_START=1071 /DNA_END=1601 /DNA_ORIENTATION=+